MKKWVKMMFVACLTLSLVAGCSKGYPDEKKILKQVQEKMEKMESVSFTVNMDMDIAMKDKDSKSTADTSKNSIRMKVDAEGEVIRTGETHVKMKMDTSIMGETQNEDADVYNVLEDDELVSYTDASGEWVKSVSVPSNQMDMFTELLNSNNLVMLEDAELKIVGTKVINQKDTYDLQIELDADMVEKLISEAMKNDEALSEMPMDLSQITNMLGDDFAMKYHIFIDQDTKEIVRASMDMKPMLEKAFDSLGALLGDDASIIVKNADMQMDYLELNKVKEIKLPKEALSAKDESEEGAEMNGDYNIEEGDIATQTHVWENMEITLDSKVIKVGETKVQALIDMGFESEDNIHKKIKKEASSYLSFGKEEESIFITAVNRAEGKEEIKDAIIEGFDTGLVQFKLAGNIGIGSTLDEVIQAYGQFTTKTTMEGTVTLSYRSEDSAKSLSLTSFDGVTIKSISLNDYSSVFK